MKRFHFHLPMQAQQLQVEEMTRLQADSRLWFQQRAGHITASRL